MFEELEILTEHFQALAALDVGAARGGEIDEDAFAVFEGVDGFRTAAHEAEGAAEEGEGFGDFALGSGVGGIAKGEFFAEAESLADLVEGGGAIHLTEEGLAETMAGGGEHGEGADVVGIGGDDLLIDANGFA